MSNDKIEVQATISADDRNSLMQGMGRHLILAAKKVRSDKDIADELRQVAGVIEQLKEEMHSGKIGNVAAENMWKDTAEQYIGLINELAKKNDYTPDKNYTVEKYEDLDSEEDNDLDLGKVAKDIENLADGIEEEITDQDLKKGAKEMWHEIHNELVDNLQNAHARIQGFINGKGYKRSGNGSGSGTHPGCNQYEHKPGCPHDKD